jgi:hypothetical protein
MSFSQEIQFKIAVDSSQAAAGFQKMTGMAQQAGQKMDAAMSGNIAAARKLNDLKTQTLFNEMNTSEKIKSVTNDIISLSKTKNALEEGSTKNLQVQYAILQKQNQLKSLYNKQTQEGQIQGGGTSGGETGGAGETSLGSMVAGGMFKRLIFMGAGAIMGAVMQAVPAFFGRQAKRAQEMEQLSESELANRQQQDIVVGGTTAEVKVAQQRKKNTAEDISILEKQISVMESEFGFEAKMALNPDIKSSYEEKQSKLVKLKLAQNEYNYAFENSIRNDAKTKLMLDSEEEAVRSLTEAQDKNALSAVQAAQIKLQKAQDLENVLKGNVKLLYYDQKTGKQLIAESGKTGTPEEIRAAEITRKQAQAALRVAEMTMTQRQVDVSQTLTEQAAGAGRTFANGRPRPLSETERLARQAMQARLQARNAVLTGAPGEAAMQQERALGLETNVADRLSFGSSDMQKRFTTDSTAIAAEITTSNQLLEAIKNSLTLTVN